MRRSNLRRLSDLRPRRKSDSKIEYLTATLAQGRIRSSGDDELPRAAMGIAGEAMKPIALAFLSAVPFRPVEPFGGRPERGIRKAGTQRGDSSTFGRRNASAWKLRAEGE